VLLAVLIDVYPALVRWITAVFPLVGLTGYLTLALRKDHDRRLEHTQSREALDLDFERKERELALENKRLDAEARRQAKLLKTQGEIERKVSGNPAELSGNIPASWRNLPESDRKVIAGLSTAEIVSRYAVSDRTARNWRAAAGGNGNGNGGGHE
jgi:hypothetical protein